MKELNFLDYLSTVKQIKRYNQYIEEDEGDQICDMIVLKAVFLEKYGEAKAGQLDLTILSTAKEWLEIKKQGRY